MEEDSQRDVTINSKESKNTFKCSTCDKVLNILDKIHHEDSRTSATAKYQLKEGLYIINKGSYT